VVWDYHTGQVLRTFLLPSTAVSITVDPADRAFYVGYESGNVQKVDFYESPSVQHPLYDARLQSTPSQIAAEHQWTAPSSEFGAAACLTLSYDGMTLLSGHQNGSILSWDIPRGRYASSVADYTHPVTNLQMLPPNGFPRDLSHDSQFTIHNIIKPRYDQTMSDPSQGAGLVPANYTLSVQLTPPPSSSSRPLVSSSAEDQSSKPDLFSEAMNHPFFPTALIEEGLAELVALGSGETTKASIPLSTGDAVDSSASVAQALEAEIASLRKQLSTNEKARRATTDELIQLRSDMSRLQDHTSDLQLKQVRSHREKATARAKKEARDLERRQAWFDAERKGQNGDALLRKARTEGDHDDAERSESDEMTTE
jgi:pre-rRNA-processing protein IPI3